MEGNHRPTEPVVDDKDPTRGGFAEIARQLNKRLPDRERPISRQLVYKWWLYRDSNDFPESVEDTGSVHRGRQLFEIAEIFEWYDRFRDTRKRGMRAPSARRGGRPRNTQCGNQGPEDETMVA